MNIHEMLSQKYWLTTSSALVAAVYALIPEQYAILMREAEGERQRLQVLHDTEDKRRHEEKLARMAVVEKIQASNTGLKVLLGDEDDDEVDERKREEERKYALHSATYRVVEGTAIIGIKGLLVNSDKWYLKFMNQVGYPHINDQLMRAYNDAEVKSVVLDIDSPGGSVNGVDQTADLIQAVGLEKPIVTAAGSILASGAYWLASQTNRIYSTQMTQAGSIGVKMQHMEYSKMLEKEGVGVTVLRKGRYKALVSNVEPLSAEAKKEIEHDMDYIYDRFTMAVAIGRGVTQDVVKTQMGEGKTFWGMEARNVGLVDEIGDLSAAVAHAQGLVENTGQL